MADTNHAKTQNVNDDEIIDDDSDCSEEEKKSAKNKTKNNNTNKTDADIDMTVNNSLGEIATLQEAELDVQGTQQTTKTPNL